MMQLPRYGLVVALLFAACGGGSPGGEPGADAALDAGPDGAVDAPDGAADAADASDGSGDGSGGGIVYESVRVTVTLDGVPVEGAIVLQGGSSVHFETGPAGVVDVPIDANIVGSLTLVASHPEARIKPAELDELTGPEATIALERYETGDNPDYAFQDPGEPRRRPNTGQCAHCHQTIGDAWFNSPHRTSASNPYVHDWFAGATHTARSEADCAERGGAWLPGREPGTGETTERCYVGEGALPTLNPGCDDGGSSCDDAPDGGACANCHAPATTGPAGEVGDQHLLAAREFAHDYGVFCDVCHRVDRVVPPTEDPENAGVGGRLILTRPSEPSPSQALGVWLPLTFGPSHDSPNVRMGSVQRDHYRDASLCGGCHEHQSAPLVDGIDLARWPGGRLPVQTTYSEWQDGVLGDATVCNDCHMPPEPIAWNGADLQRAGLSEIGVQGGWIRPPGAVRQHAWYGPRQPASRMLEHAAALFVEQEVVEGELVARVTTRNAGAGHAIPTGEPMRSLLLLVEAGCGDTSLPVTGGHVVPDIGGAALVQSASDDWTRWPGARVGDQVRVVRRPGGWIDYPGWGPFGDGTFDAEAKGMPDERYVGASTITAMDGDTATFDPPLPEGDIAYLIPADASAWAGAPGFAFARVTVDAEGRRNVPHFVAVDVASDNRLMPQVAFTTEHRFEALCAEPVVTARLVHRRFAWGEAQLRGWPMEDQVMVEVRR